MFELRLFEHRHHARPTDELRHVCDDLFGIVESRFFEMLFGKRLVLLEFVFFTDQHQIWMRKATRVHFEKPFFQPP